MRKSVSALMKPVLADLKEFLIFGDSVLHIYSKKMSLVTLSSELSIARKLIIIIVLLL